MTTTSIPGAGRASSAQAALRDQLRSGLDALDARLRATVPPLTLAQLAKRPPHGGWSVGEVLEHMCLANEQYLVPMRAMVEDPGAERAGAGAWKPSFTGGLLVRGLQARVRTKTVARIEPGPVPRPNVLGELLRTHDDVRVLMDRADGLEWRRLRMVSPLMRLVKPNFGDACLVILRHGERHAGQIERTLRAIGVA